MPDDTMLLEGPPAQECQTPCVYCRLPTGGEAEVCPWCEEAHCGGEG